MATENVPVFNKYDGNGAATEFSIGFPYLDTNFIKVYIKRIGEEEEKLDDSRFSFVNDTTIKFPVLETDTVLQEGEVITIQRETSLGSEYEFDNQVRLFPEEVMNADDLSFQQIQELARDLERAVKVKPTDEKTSDELIDEVYSSLKTATETTEKAIISANQAQEAVDNAIAAVEETQRQVEEVIQSVDVAKDEINQTVTNAQQEINSTVDEAQMDLSDTIQQAVEDVKREAVEAAEGAISDATATVTGIVVDYTNNEIKPELVGYKDIAETSATLARTWATGTDDEVQAIEADEHSSRTYAEQAEKSAIAAAEAADRAEAATGGTGGVSGKVIQLGFDGARVRTGLEFKHAPSGVEIPYTLEENQEYEIDLAFNGTLPVYTSGIYIKNGSDTINIVSTLHRDSTKYVRIGNMEQVMRYNSDTGYRWLFKAVYKITPAGNKVFLIYPVIAKEDIDIIDLGELLPSSSSSIRINKVHKAVVQSHTSFYAPTVTDTSIVNQFKIFLKFNGDYSIDWGPSIKFYNGVIPTIENGGTYEVFYEYNPNEGVWVVGVLSVEAA